MKIQHDQTLLPPDKESILSRIESSSWTYNSSRLAVCASRTNHIIIISGNSLDQKDKFPLKALEKDGARDSFTVKGIAFSPDGMRLAIGQTDGVIFIYKVSDDKKVIIGKIPIPTSCTTLYWTEAGIIFGSLDGKVKLINTSTNRMTNVISSNSMVIAMSIAGNDVVVGFLAGAVVFTQIGRKESSRQLHMNGCPPFALSISIKGSVCLGGCDGRITFLDVNDASKKQIIEIGTDIVCCSASNSGNVMAVGSMDKVIIFISEPSSDHWKQKDSIQLDGGYYITCISFSNDSTKLAVGTVNGALELFSFSWKKKIQSDRHTVDFVGNQQILVNHSKLNIKGTFNSTHEIRDVKISNEYFVIIWTSDTLLVGDIRNPKKVSEVEWMGIPASGCKFCFDYDNVVLVNVVGELYLIELGSNEFLSSVRTDFVNPHLMSVRINERNSGRKVLAYLLDLKTIAVIDLLTSIQMCVSSHDLKIDWIELNETGKKLLFRDRRQRLHLLHIETAQVEVMLSVCSFVQWVPGSDVVVAQSQDKLYIYYDMKKPVIHELAGGSKTEASGIERENGVTRVTFSGGKNSLQLDETFLEFDTALQDGDLSRALQFLESTSGSSSQAKVSPDTDSMWHQLGTQALKQNNLLIAERAFAGCGDISRATYIRECNDDSTRLALLEKDWASFEAGSFETVVDTYIRLNQWHRAIDLGERTGRIEDKKDLEEKYFKWLMKTGQEAEAGILQEKSGKLEEAVDLYCKAGRLVEAARVILQHGVGSKYGPRPRASFPPSKVNSLIEQLKESSFYQEAGKLAEKVDDDPKNALSIYRIGKCFDSALDLARREFPDEVVSIEGEFGSHLLESGDYSSAVNHFIQAGLNDKALQASIQSSNYERAYEIASSLDPVPLDEGKQIGYYFVKKGDIEKAVEIFMNAGLGKEAVSVLVDKGDYVRAVNLGRRIGIGSEVIQALNGRGNQLKEEGNLKEAEKIFLTLGDSDTPITFYKMQGNYDQMIRLVKQFHPDLVNDTLLHLGKELKQKGDYTKAESMYNSAGEWMESVKMYSEQGMWSESFRIVSEKSKNILKVEIAYYWSKSLNHIQNEIVLLNRLGLLNAVIDFAVDRKDFEFALEMTKEVGGKEMKMKDILSKYANSLDQEGKCSEAEKVFLMAEKPREAVMMYLNRKDYASAIRVADVNIQDATVTSDILVAQAKDTLESGGRETENMMRVESLLLRGERIELAVKMYKDYNMWSDALRVCEQYCPNLVDPLKREMNLMGIETNKPSFNRTHSADEDDDPVGEDDIRIKLSQSVKNKDREREKHLTLLLAAHLIKNRDPLGALNAIDEHQMVLTFIEGKKILTRIATDLLSFEFEPNPSIKSWILLRDLLFQLSLTFEEIERLTFIIHLMTMKSVLEQVKNQVGSQDILTKVVTSLLRYTEMIRVDKAFYEAGNANKLSNRLDMAFVFWNHYLDLVDAIEEGDTNVDHTDFENTDIPNEVPLPSTPFFKEPSILDSVKGWILNISMDSSVSHSLPSCPFRNGRTYEGSIINMTDGSHSMACVVTGYPVSPSKMLEMKEGKYAANKDDWNKLLMLTKVTNSNDLKQILMFIGKMCGNSSVGRFSFQ